MKPLMPSRPFARSTRLPSPLLFHRCRKLHRTPYDRSTVSTASSHAVSPPSPPTAAPAPPLSILPLSTLVRSYLITTLSASPLLLGPSLRILRALAHSGSPFLNPDANVLLRWVLKKTFYAQFCAGETREEVGRTVGALKGRGFAGVILGYAREVVVERGEAGCSGGEVGKSAREADADVEIWKKGTLETVEMAEKGDFVALKFTGAGSHTVHLLSKKHPPDAALEKATVEICNLATARGVRLLFDAEQQAVQGGIDGWTLDFQKRYNCTTPGKAVVYGTYQAYLRSTPATLARDLASANAGRFTLGVKLVRGAYLGSDPRHLFWSTKEDTDRVYDGIAESLIRRTYGDVLIPLHGEGNEKFPDVNLVLASHNHESVRKVMVVRREQLESGEERVDLVYGQLMGMADEVSCELVQAGKGAQGLDGYGVEEVDVPQAYKYLVWGTVGECVKYLLRRAEENRDAVVRTREGRSALKTELVRRLGL